MYEQQIERILLEVGKRGISVHLLAKHVYNLNCTLFYQPDIHQVVKEVRNYVIRKSTCAHPSLERTGRWGYYRLNARGISQARQLMQELQNAEEVNEQEEGKPPQDLSLCLFDDY